MIACLMIPCFGAALARQTLRGAETPLLVAQYRGGRGRVIAADARALEADVRPEMALSRARALCPDAAVTLFQPSLLRRAVAELLEALSQFSQYAEWERGKVQTAVFLLDLGKLKPAVGTALGEQMVQAVAAMGYSACVGLAAAPFTARLAALETAPSSVKLVHAEETRRFLAKQPSHLLPATKETARRLDLLGLRRIGQIADIPRSALAVQFGREGERLHRLACGQDGHRVPRYVPPETAHTSKSFEPPLDDGLIVQSALHALAADLMTPLIETGRTCGEIILTVRLDDGSEQEAIQRPRTPLANRLDVARVLLHLFSQQKHPAPVTEITVQIGRFAAVKPRQLSLFDEDKPATPLDLLRDLSDRYGETLFYSVVAGQPTSLLPELRFTLEALDTEAA
jgi:protein ImuB